MAYLQQKLTQILRTTSTLTHTFHCIQEDSQDKQTTKVEIEITKKNYYVMDMSTQYN